MSKGLGCNTSIADKVFPNQVKLRESIECTSHHVIQLVAECYKLIIRALILWSTDR